MVEIVNIPVPHDAAFRDPLLSKSGDVGVRGYWGQILINGVLIRISRKKKN